MGPGRRGDGDGRARGGAGGAPGKVRGGVVSEQRNPGRRNVHFALERALLTARLECKMHVSNARCTSRVQNARLDEQRIDPGAPRTPPGGPRPAQTSTHSVPAGTTTSAVSDAPGSEPVVPSAPGGPPAAPGRPPAPAAPLEPSGLTARTVVVRRDREASEAGALSRVTTLTGVSKPMPLPKIGRASCRERV